MNHFKKLAFLAVGLTLVLAPVAKADDHSAKSGIAAPSDGTNEAHDKTLLAKPAADAKVAKDVKKISEATCEKCKGKGNKDHKDCKECKKMKCEKCGEDMKNCKCKKKSCEHCDKAHAHNAEAAGENKDAEHKH